jgi:hypothetical protein
MAELKLSTINKKAKEANQRLIHEFEDGEKLTFYPIFPTTKIKELLDDYRELLTEAKENDIDLSEKMIFELIHLLCVKHFTHLGKQIKPGLSNHLSFLKALDDAEYYKPIMEEVFMAKEIQKVYSHVTDILGTHQLIQKLSEQAQLKFESLQIKNKEAFAQLEQLGNEESTQSE